MYRAFLIAATLLAGCGALPAGPQFVRVRVVSSSSESNGAWACGARGFTVVEVVETAYRQTVCGNLGTPGETFNIRADALGQ